VHQRSVSIPDLVGRPVELPDNTLKSMFESDCFNPRFGGEAGRTPSIITRTPMNRVSIPDLVGRPVEPLV